jgi:hypothetical protein
MNPPYPLSEHIHRFASWTAACAVRRNFAGNEVIGSVIDTVKLRTHFDANLSADSFDQAHRNLAHEMITNFRTAGVPTAKVTYGRMAKIIAIYLKTAIVIPEPECPLSKVAHPPVDRILLTNLHRKHKQYRLNQYNWTQLGEEAYFEVIESLRKIAAGDPLWTLERYWEMG